MSRWIATTASGRTYEEVEGGVRVSGEGRYPQPTMRSFPQSMLGGMDWDKLYALPEVDRPVVGERFFIATHGDAGWRISTEIVSVEDVE